MSKSIKFKNLYFDSTGVTHKKHVLKHILNNYAFASYNTTFDFLGGTHKYIPFNSSKIDSDNLTLNGGKIIIGKNVNTVKVSYDVRMDWDAPLDTTYYFMLNKGGDFWETHHAIYKNYYTQQDTSVASFVMNVTEGNEIGLKAWFNGSGTKSAVIFVSIYIEVLD